VQATFHAGARSDLTDSPSIQYVKTSDGFNIASSVVGEGRPVVLVPPLFTNLNNRTEAAAYAHRHGLVS